jgi:hypothetical protein
LNTAVTAIMPSVLGAFAVVLNFPVASVFWLSIWFREEGCISSEADSYKKETSELGIGCRVILSTNVPVMLNFSCTLKRFYCL